ncbi:hypothetical protein M0G74_04775 [Microbulbifer sp. CAU 1566]|uniref:hypothetical protein n=1 Tax=Microbulbifer sp. CAU 1566 TaxID=2933269 RepID=UPI0020035D04|nr:hypothetical protein [Microbulbifer sp. CAU 1566]MCK7596585.1 hypothetical protein [Microbulbifer sp. CAU 1566]
MPNMEQLKSILKSYGVSEHSMAVIQARHGSSIFVKMSKSDQTLTGRETHRYPHISPAYNDTPAHLTDIRFVKTVGAHDVFQRFHRHIDDNLNLTGERHDRFQAVERNSGAIYSVSVTGGRGPAATDVRSLEELRGLTFSIGLRVHEYQRYAVMSRAVMNKYNLGVRT